MYIFTHDSIGLGEDGPTHQPIEQLPPCAQLPIWLVLRPGDANEVVEAYKSPYNTCTARQRWSSRGNPCPPTTVQNTRQLPASPKVLTSR